MNSPHRIALKTHWKVEEILDPPEVGRWAWKAYRTFHRPTGLTNGQIVQFCFQPGDAASLLLVGAGYLPLNTTNGLASAEITDIMHEVNRVEIRWQNGSIDPSRFSECFTAWLEISENNPSPA